MTEPTATPLPGYRPADVSPSATGGYSIFEIDRAGLPVARQDILCSNDAQALAMAHERTDNHATEVWQGERKIGFVE
jgi:hypothetical protein